MGAVECEPFVPPTEREGPLESTIAAAARAVEARRHEILVAISNPETAPGLISLAARLCRPGDTVVALRIVPVAHNASLSAAQRHVALTRRFRDLMQLAVKKGSEAGAKVVPVLQVAHNVAGGIVEAAKNRPGTRLLLLGWSGATGHGHAGADICRKTLREANCDVAIFLNRNLSDIRRVLVPAAGGPHARLGLRLAADLVRGRTAELVALRVARERAPDTTPDLAVIKGLIRDEIGNGDDGPAVLPRVTRSKSVAKGIIDETERGCDLLVIGVSEESPLHEWLFGSIPTTVASGVSCSLLLVRKHEPSPVSWIRRTARNILRAANEGIRSLVAPNDSRAFVLRLVGGGKGGRTIMGRRPATTGGPRRRPRLPAGADSRRGR